MLAFKKQENHINGVIVSVLILRVGIAQVYKQVKSVALWLQKISLFLHIRGNQLSFLHGLYINIILRNRYIIIIFK